MEILIQNNKLLINNKVLTSEQVINQIRARVVEAIKLINSNELVEIDSINEFKSSLALSEKNLHEWMETNKEYKEFKELIDSIRKERLALNKATNDFEAQQKNKMMMTFVGNIKSKLLEVFNHQKKEIQECSIFLNYLKDAEIKGRLEMFLKGKKDLQKHADLMSLSNIQSFQETVELAEKYGIPQIMWSSLSIDNSLETKKLKLDKLKAELEKRAVEEKNQKIEEEQKRAVEEKNQKIEAQKQEIPTPTTCDAPMAQVVKVSNRRTLKVLLGFSNGVTSEDFEKISNNGNVEIVFAVYATIKVKSSSQAGDLERIQKNLKQAFKCEQVKFID